MIDTAQSRDAIIDAAKVRKMQNFSQLVDLSITLFFPPTKHRMLFTGKQKAVESVSDDGGRQ